ncbi:aminotransferase class V-fold PLP-dependent enzyme [Pseudactinotalea sp. Z1748]|uniref:aminotransferase class V-fold PLP-dependent enzyme n=1 Tax=Pseudactinotalea sp. Z1748 TaxID=3413027 RepID=UPI003C7AFD89
MTERAASTEPTTGPTEPTTAPAPEPLLVDGAPAETLWPLDPDQRHLNHGSFGAVPNRVLEYQADLRDSMEASPIGWFGQLPDRVNAARAQMADLLHLPAGGTVFVPNASAGMSVAYASLALPRGADVVVTNHGYGAVVQGARRAAARAGGTVTVVDVPLGASDDDAETAILAAIGSRTAMLVLDHITSATATLFPVQRICRRARELGVLTVVDGAHSPGVLAQPWTPEADVWVGNLHKFACAPRGSAVLVAREEVRQDLFPLVDSWGGTLAFPERFNFGGTDDLTSYLAAPFAYDYLDQVLGWTAIRTYTGELADYGQAVVSAAMSEATGQDAHVSLRHPVGPYRLIALPRGLGHTREDADRLRDEILQALGIEAAFTSFDGRGYCRLSTHAYTVAADHEDFAARAVPWLVEAAHQ